MVQAVDYKPRCCICGRVLGEYMGRPWSVKCRRCGTTNYVPASDGVRPPNPIMPRISGYPPREDWWVSHEK